MKLVYFKSRDALSFFSPFRITYPRDHTFTHKTKKIRVTLEEISHSYRDVTKAGDHFPGARFYFSTIQAVAEYINLIRPLPPHLSCTGCAYSFLNLLRSSRTTGSPRAMASLSSSLGGGSGISNVTHS